MRVFLSSLPGRMRHSRGAAFGLVLAAGIGVGAGAMAVFTAPPPEVAEEDHAAELPPGVVEIPEAAQTNAGIEVVEVATMSMPGTLEVTGIVAPNGARVAHVRPLARGVVDRIGVTLGSRVSEGQTLLTYDNIELGQLVGEYLGAQAALRQARTNQDLKQSTLARAESLITIEAIARQEVDVRRAELRNAEAAVASAEAGVSQIEEQLHRFGLNDAAVRALTPQSNEGSHRVASHSALRAPFAGVVTKFDVATGEVIEPEKDLLTVADISTVWVLADVYERDISRIRRDGTVTITVDAYPDRIFTGRVTNVSDLIDPATRTAKVRCVVDNRDGLLKLDMFAKVTLSTNGATDVLAIPSDAVQTIDAETVVFIQESATRFVRRTVEIGRRANHLVEVLAGLEPGDRVVGKGSFYLKTASLRERIGDEH